MLPENLSSAFDGVLVFTPMTPPMDLPTATRIFRNWKTGRAVAAALVLGGAAFGFTRGNLTRENRMGYVAMYQAQYVNETLSILQMIYIET